jgi:hypothetical protein
MCDVSMDQSPAGSVFLFFYFYTGNRVTKKKKRKGETKKPACNKKNTFIMYFKKVSHIIYKV